jgi:uncharacterized membrane protein
MLTTPEEPSSRTDRVRGGSAKELTRQNVARVLALETAEHGKATLGDRVARAITGFSGSMTFVSINFLAMAAWVGFNVVVVPPSRFDPFPFSLLTLILSVEAIFLGIFILISQNRDAKVTEKRANLDLQLNLLSEQENTKMLLMLERIGDAVGAQMSKDADVQALAQDVRPEELSDMLDEAAEKDEHGPNRT